MVAIVVVTFGWFVQKLNGPDEESSGVDARLDGSCNNHHRIPVTRLPTIL